MVFLKEFVQPCSTDFSLLWQLSLILPLFIVSVDFKHITCFSFQVHKKNVSTRRTFCWLLNSYSCIENESTTIDQMEVSIKLGIS